jgi:hypothetical protein
MDSVTPLLAATLDTLARQQASFVAAHGRYAASIREVGWAPAQAGIRVVVLSADSSGWSAMAVSVGVADVSCVAADGAASLPVVLDSASDHRVCGRGGGSFSRRLIAAPDTGLAYVVLDRPPEEHCPVLRLTPSGRANVTHRETVILEFALDTLGQPEPAFLKVTGGDDYNASQMALESLSHCAFSPGRVARRPVRVILDVPFVFSP